MPKVYYLFLLLSIASFNLSGQGTTCTEAEIIESSGVFEANGPSSGNGCHACTNANHSSWYKFESQEKSLLTINSCSFFASNTNLFVYRGNCGNLNLVAQNDDGCGAVYGNAAYLEEILVLPGETYYLEWNNEHDEEDFEFEFTVEKITTECSKPFNFQLDSIHKTSAYFSWQSANNDNFFIEYGPIGFQPGSANIIQGQIGIDGPPVEISNLEEGELYQVFAYEMCDNGHYSDTTSSIYFRSGYLCRAPSFFSFELDSVSPNYAKINWESRNPSASFEFSYSKRPFNKNSSTKITGIVNTDGPPVELVNLEEKTEYEFIYIEQCEEGTSDTISRYFITPPWCHNPSNPVQTFKADHNVIIEWQSENENTEYEIHYSKRPWNYQGGMIKQGINSDLFAEIENLEKNSIYDAFLIEKCENGYPSDSVFFNFSTNFSPLENDSCSLAIPINCGETDSQSLENANYTQNNSYCGTITFGNDAWYILNGDNKLFQISTCGSEFNASIMVFEGTCDSLICVGGSNENKDCQYPGSYFEFNGKAGKTYYIKVASNLGSGGAYSLQVNCTDACLPTPENDICSTAHELKAKANCQFISGNNICASVNPNFNNCAPFERVQDIWYQFVYQGENNLSTIVNHESDTYFNAALYESCELDLLQCFGTIPANQEFELNVNDLEIGQSYFLQIWNEGFEFANSFEICLLGESSTAIDDRYSSQISIFPNPTSNQLNIHNSEMVRSYSIIDGLGNSVITSTQITPKIDVKELSSGIYLLQLETNNDEMIKKTFIKN